jgi:hypothetical protein
MSCLTSKWRLTTRLDDTGTDQAYFGAVMAECGTKADSYAASLVAEAK